MARSMKRLYLVIATALNDSQGAQFEVVAETMADALEEAYSHGPFDRQAFLDVCFARTEEARAVLHTHTSWK